MQNEACEHAFKVWKYSYSQEFDFELSNFDGGCKLSHVMPPHMHWK